MGIFGAVCINLVISPQKLTEQRLPVFSHEIVPDYLRTKPDPEVEEQEKQLSAEAARIGVEVAQVRPRLSFVLVMVLDELVYCWHGGTLMSQLCAADEDVGLTGAAQALIFGLFLHLDLNPAFISSIAWT